ncbi:MAG: VIT1/CCC1 transporter family protein [Halobacteriaceae archaeon]
MAADDDAVERYRRHRQDEVDSATVYEAMAEAETREQLAAVYRRLAATERDHAAAWAARLAEAGAPVPDVSPSWRARVLAWVARRLGPDAVVATMRAGEASGADAYAGQSTDRAAAMAADERSHDRLLAAIDAGPGRGAQGGVLASLEGRHRATSGNALRAAVLGANDGLVSNLSLVMGVAGAALGARTILVTGLAGLLAGAGSMAMGEWLSVQSSRELYQRQIAVEREELVASPAAEREELALIYEAKGLGRDQAERLADRLTADEATALDTLAREELGVDPEELGGSAWEAAGASFVLFAVGAVVPVLPFAALSGLAAVGASLLASALALFAVGAAITVLTGRSLLYSGARQVAIGLAAAALTYAVGSLIGVSLAG